MKRHRVRGVDQWAACCLECNELGAWQLSTVAALMWAGAHGWTWGKRWSGESRTEPYAYCPAAACQKASESHTARTLSIVYGPPVRGRQGGR